jgi:hypothetical protein
MVPELGREAGYREGSAGGVEAAEWEERRRVIELQNEEARREKKRRKQQAEVEARAQVKQNFYGTCAYAHCLGALWPGSFRSGVL